MAKNFLIELDNTFDEENQVEKMDFEIQGQNFSLFFIESLIDKKLLTNSVISPLEKLKENLQTKRIETKISLNDEKLGQKNYLVEMIKSSVPVSGATILKDIEEILSNIFSGSAVVVFENTAISFPIFGVEKRSIAEPPSSKVIKGPREGFVEDIYTNTGLIRKRIKSEDLKIKTIAVGEKSKSVVSVFYIKNVAKSNVVDGVMKVLKSINIDAIIDSYYIQSYLEGNSLKFFKRVGSTEKPDIFTAKILEGRVGILVDGSPIALTVPFMLLEDLQSAGDYYSIPASSTFTRMMRFFGLGIALLLPAIYVSLQSYNYRILPINFLITLLSSIEGLSIPPLLEILLVLFLFEIISEASVLMPSALGMALSIIGALALGNTAVDAGIISPPSIVIVAVSSVALHIIPGEYDEARLLRILFTTIGGIIGLYGIFVCVLLLITYLCTIESFGVPYLTPYSPTVDEDKKDGFVMKSIQEMNSRPILISGEDKIRQSKKLIASDSDKFNSNKVKNKNLSNSKSNGENKKSDKNEDVKIKQNNNNNSNNPKTVNLNNTKNLKKPQKSSNKPENSIKKAQKTKNNSGKEENEWQQDNFILF